MLALFDSLGRIDPFTWRAVNIAAQSGLLRVVSGDVGAVTMVLRAGLARSESARSSEVADYDAFFRAHHGHVVRVCHALLGDRARAEEVTQEAFIRLYTRWRRVSAYDRPEAWVRRVAVRLAVRVLRRDRLRPSLERRSVLPQATSAAPEGDLLALVARLPRNQRLAVVLHYIEDMPVNDVAAVLGCAESTARVHLHRGRKRLAELIAVEVPGE